MLILIFICNLHIINVLWDDDDDDETFNCAEFTMLLLMWMEHHCTWLPQVITTQRELTRTDEENRALTDLALRGLQLLSSWNVRIMELVINVDIVCGLIMGLQLPITVVDLDEENRALTDLALRGLQLLSSWNVRIMELVINVDIVCGSIMGLQLPITVVDLIVERLILLCVCLTVT